MLPTKFQVNWPIHSGDEAKNRVSRWPLSYPIITILAIFYPQVTPMLPISLSVQEKRNIDFLDGLHGGHFQFLIGTILAIFDLQVTLMLPTKFRVNWPFSSGEEVENRFSR